MDSEECYELNEPKKPHPYSNLGAINKICSKKFKCV